MVLHGNAVGGGSITYANTLLVPRESVWRQGSWAGLDAWERVMPAHYAEAERMLGVTVNQRPAADERLRAMAAATGVADTWHLTRVGVFFGGDGDPGDRDYPDPYFGGEGPPRRSCTGCGGCMVGCRVGAKNSLDRNYLHLAQRRGVVVHAQTRVTRIVPLPAPDGRADTTGRHGYAVHAVGTADGRTHPKRWTARAVVCAAGSLGTQALLMEARRRGDLPHLSAALGHHVRTNAESLIGVRWPGCAEDLSRGVAIGSAIRLDAHTTVEATRYPAGSDAMALLSTVMGRDSSRFAWAGALLRGLLTAPRATVRLLRAVLDQEDEWVRAIGADFGRRSASETRLLELGPLADEIRYLRRHVARWMRPQRVPVNPLFRPARARIVPQPLGVVGIIGAWNYPLQLTLSPLANALAAGNHVLLKPSELAPYTAALRDSVRRRWPRGAADPDYTALVSSAAWERMQRLAREAADNGATLVPLMDTAAQPDVRAMGPVAVLDPPAGCALMREEIFGPLLPVLPYDTLEQAIAHVNAGPRPLALYLFERDARAIEHVLQATTSGGVTVNDCMLHQPQHTLPFGGVGASGIGAYHGRHGFERFSHRKGVYLQHPLVGAVFDRWVRPPYGPFVTRLLRWMLRR